ncbi:amidohydrolase family protein [Pseudomarimonas arenosa]|uniref:Amidohydrolase family protein n=1 Tax=Pseudomarimonas arenosa TaxID=2774145 RepID=A0AAW3ZUB9_9GAMM|nr:amidohydrolase family protein [Pseudomarimonas arenosa]MBD8527666.1 amidohydrolase family protein [Pseudomarimonas arenosa]
MRSIRSTLGAIAPLCFALLCSSIASAEQLLIREITLVSPERSAPLPNVDVLIGDGRIVAISPERLDIGSARVIEGRGKFLSPGLIDSHVHLGSSAGMREDQAEQYPDLQRSFLAQEPRSFLYFGFTHLVDLNQSESFVAEWAKHPIAPTLSYCKALPFPNGYGEAFLPESQRGRSPYLLDDPHQHNTLPDDYQPEQHSPKALIEKVRKTQARCIKTFYEKGFAGLWDWPVPPDALMAHVKREAKGADLIHVHHGNSLASYQQAAASGVDVLAHGLWHWDALNSERELPTDIRQLLDRLIAQGTAIQPTSQVLGAELRLFEPGFLDDPRLRHAVPGELITWYRSDEAQWFARRMAKNLERTEVVRGFLGHEPTGAVDETSRVAAERLRQVVRYAHERGGRLILGSDTPSSPTYTNPPGLNGLLEMRWLADAGLSPGEVMRAATLDNARAFGLASEIGSIEVGKRADLLVLSADPLASVEAFDSIDVVVLGGRAIRRAELSAQSPSVK